MFIFKYLWNFLLGLTMYSSFIENEIFKKSLIKIGRHAWLFSLFIIEHITQIVAQ